MVRDALAEITELSANKGNCVLIASIDRVPEDLRGGLIKALKPDSGLPSTAIGKWLAREGVLVSDRSIQRHRGGTCGCFR